MLCPVSPITHWENACTGHERGYIPRRRLGPCDLTRLIEKRSFDRINTCENGRPYRCRREIGANSFAHASQPIVPPFYGIAEPAIRQNGTTRIRQLSVLEHAKGIFSSADKCVIRQRGCFVRHPNNLSGSQGPS